LLGNYVRLNDPNKIEVAISSMVMADDTTVRSFAYINLGLTDTTLTVSNRLQCALSPTSITATGSPFIWEWYLKTTVVSSHVVPGFDTIFCGGPGATFTYT
jgi:hypothetical protein